MPWPASSDGRRRAFQRIAVLLGLAAAAALLGAVCRSLAGLVAEGQARAVSDHLHELVHAKAADIDLEYYETARYHDALHRAQQEGAYRPTRIVNGLVQVAQNSLALLLMAGVLVSFHWGTAIVLFVAAVPGVLMRFRQAQPDLREPARPDAGRAARAVLPLDADRGRSRQGASPLRSGAPVPAAPSRPAPGDPPPSPSVGHVAFPLGSGDPGGAPRWPCSARSPSFSIARRWGALTVGDVVMYYQAFQRGQDFLKEILSGLAGTVRGPPVPREPVRVPGHGAEGRRARPTPSPCRGPCARASCSTG